MPVAKRIICAVDFSEGSEHAVNTAVELARGLDSDLELLHVFQIPAFALPDAPISVSPLYVAELTSKAQEGLEAERARVQGRGVNVATRLLQGSPAETIVSHAKESGACMIVIGTHGRSGFRRFLLGSVAERVVRIATVPVLTVHLSPSEQPEKSSI